MGDKFRAIRYEEIVPDIGSSATSQDLTYYTEEENKFRQEVRAWAKREILPYAADIERNDDKKLALELAKKACRAGYSNQMIPRAYGGGERSCVAETIVTEEIAAVCFAAEGGRMPTVLFIGFPLYKFGTEAQRQKYLIPLMKGEKAGAMGLTEPGAASDISRMETTAVKKGSDWILNGEKRFIGNGSVADYLMVFAVTNPEARFEERITAFIVERERPGFEVVKDFEHMGWRGTANAWFRLNDYVVPEANVLGKLHGGFRVAMDELDAERVLAAALSLGQMRSAYEVAVKYSLEREQFGTKISNFEGISFKIAEMYGKIEATRLAIWRAARQIDLGLPAPKQAAFAKLYSSESSVEVTQTALQVIGGIAYSKDYPIEQYVRNCRVTTIIAGTSEIQQFILAREILREARKWPLLDANG